MARLKHLPIVAIIGRSNVGKSTLFNRLTEEELALVSRIPGTTREQNLAEVEWRGKPFFLIDTPGLDASHAGELEDDVAAQANRAIKTADVILFVVDGRLGRHAQDDVLAKALRKANKPVILSVNKLDSDRAWKNVDTDFFAMGYDSAGFSARTGAGTGDLLDKIVTLLPKKKNKDLEESVARITIMGRPNVGKSSLFNAVIGEDRVLVSPFPNTTRDLHDTDIEYKKQTISLIDTVGLRKRLGLMNQAPKEFKKEVIRLEKDMIGRTEAAIRRADVVWYVVTADKKITRTDKALIDIALETSRGLMIVVNKWDLVPDKGPATINEFRAYFKSMFPSLPWAKFAFVSAIEKQRTTRLLDMSLEIRANQQRTIPAGDLKRFIAKVERRYQPMRSGTVAPGRRKQPLKLHGLRQTEVNPPTFLLYTKRPKDVAPAFANILEKEIRKEWDFSGTPIRLVIK